MTEIEGKQNETIISDNNRNSYEKEYTMICSSHRDSIFHLLHGRKEVNEFIHYCQNSKVVYISRRMNEIISCLLNTFSSIANPKILEESIGITSSILSVSKRSCVKKADRTPLCEVLNFYLGHLENLNSRFLMLRNSSEVFAYITDGNSIMEPFLSFLRGNAEINQAKVKRAAMKIEVFGVLDDPAFLEKLQELSTRHLRIEGSPEDKATMLRQVFDYCGGSEILPGNLHNTTIFSGSATEDFRQFLEVPEGQKLGGTLGGIVTLKIKAEPEEREEIVDSLEEACIEESNYLVTAGHCLVDYGANSEGDCNPQVVVQYDSEGDFAMVKLKASPPQSFNFRNQLAIEDDLDLYSFSFSPWITIKELEPGCAVYKVGKESNFTCGVYEGEFSLVTTMASNRTVIERKNVVAISALGLNDSAFAKDGDSGSLYYAVRGSFRYPFAIHNGEGYDKIQVLSPDLFPYH